MKSFSSDTSSFRTGYFCLRHNGIANVLFADGHVAGLTRSGLSEIGFGNTVIKER